MMMQSIGDYENWRDAQHDRPMPDDGPDERSVRFYSQDYPADTVLEYTRTGDRSELRLSFSYAYVAASRTKRKYSSISSFSLNFAI